MAKNPTESVPAVPPGLVNARTCLRLVFPDPESRPSIKWFEQLKSDGYVPFRKIRGLNFYDPIEVRASLDRLFKSESCLPG
jgi:hypothetical protein